jgi:hypothetical protein
MRWIFPCFLMFASAPALAATASASVTVEIVPAIGLQTDMIDGLFPQTRLISSGNSYFWINGEPTHVICADDMCRKSKRAPKQLIIDMP